MSLTVGLTGGICSGKSLACSYFEGQHIDVYDADIFSRKLVKPGQPALQEIIDCFGSSFLTPTHELDRKKLRQLVFSEPAARKQLEEILHPAIRHLFKESREKSTSRYHIFCMPLLFESDMQDLVDRVLVMDASEGIRISRMLERDGINPSEAKAILESQMPQDRRNRLADDLVENSGSREDTLSQLKQLHSLYLKL